MAFGNKAFTTFAAANAVAPWADQWLQRHLQSHQCGLTPSDVLARAERSESHLPNSMTSAQQRHPGRTTPPKGMRGGMDV